MLPSLIVLSYMDSRFILYGLLVPDEKNWWWESCVGGESGKDGCLYVALVVSKL